MFQNTHQSTKNQYWQHKPPPVGPHTIQSLAQSAPAGPRLRPIPSPADGTAVLVPDYTPIVTQLTLQNTPNLQIRDIQV